MSFKQDSPFGPATEALIDGYEAALGYKLPADYRGYLLRWNGASPLKTDYPMPGEDEWIESVDTMLGLGPEDHPQSLQAHLKEDDGIPEGWIPIAESGYGDYTVLSVRPEDYGKVFYLFHEVHGYDPDNREDGVYPLADSFTDWIAGLQDLVEEE